MRDNEAKIRDVPGNTGWLATLCHSLPASDSPIPPQHAGAALPCASPGGVCTHAVVASPTPQSRRGSDLDCSAVTERAE